VLKHVRAGKEDFRREVELAGFTCVGERNIPGMVQSYFLVFRKQPRRSVTGHTVDGPREVKLLMEAGVASLVDVREQKEWDAGHLAAAKLLPLSVLEKLAGKPNGAAQLERMLPKDKVLYVHCRSGRRALIAGKILERFGYDARPLRGGYADLVKAGFSAAVPKKAESKEKPATGKSQGKERAA
jgi:rhodanese-related sulfurtransferase